MAHASLCWIVLLAQVDPGVFLIPGNDCESCPKGELQRLGDSITRAASALQNNTIADSAAEITRREYQDNTSTFVRRRCAKYAGTEATTVPPRVVPPPIETDCFALMLNVVLPEAFARHGKTEQWERVRRRAVQISTEMGHDGIVGIGLMRALQEHMGWTGIFWAPNSATANAEHGNIATRTADAGSYYGLDTDTDKLVIDYHADTTNLIRLRRLPFAILAARSGDHMALLADGVVYEIHRSYGCERPDVFEATPIQRWHWWSGAIVAPAEDVERAWAWQPPDMSAMPWLLPANKQ